MSRLSSVRPEFVDFIPKELEDGVLYISIPYTTAVHKCACGCGSKITTPIRPTGWRFTYDGETVSLDPSIGNWSYPCQSHYWITRNRVEWAAKWSREKIEAGRRRDRQARQRYYEASTPLEHPQSPADDRLTKLRQWIKSFFGR